MVTPATFGFEATAAQLPISPPPPPPPGHAPNCSCSECATVNKEERLVEEARGDENDNDADHGRRYVQLHVRWMAVSANKCCLDCG